MLRGGAGIGKTALLADARDRASDMQRARGARRRVGVRAPLRRAARAPPARPAARRGAAGAPGGGAAGRARARPARRRSLPHLGGLPQPAGRGRGAPPRAVPRGRPAVARSAVTRHAPVRGPAPRRRGRGGAARRSAGTTARTSTLAGCPRSGYARSARTPPPRSWRAPRTATWRRPSATWWCTRPTATRWRCSSCRPGSPAGSWRAPTRCPRRCRSPTTSSGCSWSACAACRRRPSRCCCWSPPATRGGSRP